MGKMGVSFSKLGTSLRLLRVEAVDGFDFEQSVVFLGLFRRAHLADDEIAGAQSEAADLALADVDVFRAGQQTVTAQEADAVLDDFQNAAAKDIALVLCAGAKQAHHKIVFLESGIARDIQSPRNVAQFLQIHGIQLRDRHVCDLLL